jgi:E3 ubiquitin-protein transferase RMND5
MSSLSTLEKDLAGLNQHARLSAAVYDVENVIMLLQNARDEIAESLDPHTAGLTMTKLQGPFKERLEYVNEDLKKVSKVQKEFGRALDKVSTPWVDRVLE